MPRKKLYLDPTTTIRIRVSDLHRLRVLLAEEGLIRGKRVNIIDWFSEVISQGESRLGIRKEARKLLTEQPIL